MRSTRSTSRTRLVSVLIGLALIVVAAAGYRLSTPQLDFQVLRGTLGEFHRYHTGTAQVSEVQVGTRIAEGDAEVGTPGLFVVLRLRVQAPGDVEVHIQNVQLLAGDGTTYEPFLGGQQVFADPGFETTGEVVFEVSPSRIDDLTVQVWDAKFVVGYSQRLRVHLGITAANASQWVQAGQGQVLEVESSDTTRGLP